MHAIAAILYFFSRKIIVKLQSLGAKIYTLWLIPSLGKSGKLLRILYPFSLWHGENVFIEKNHKGAILTINDRATSRVWIRKLSGKEAIPVAKIAVWALRKVKNLIHTITADNGKEFAKHEEIAQKLEIKFYFCKPYHSWERGANENTNGLIRQYIPKGKDFSEVTNKQIKWIENKLNNRPRKRLGYLTPNEKFKQIINQNSVAFAS